MAVRVSPIEIVARETHQLLGKAEHWLRVPLQQVATVQNGFAFQSQYFDREDGVPLIRIRDIRNDSTEHRYTGAYDDTYVVRKGDILIGMDGDFVASRWKGELALLNQRVCRVKPISSYFDEDFLFLCLQPYLDAINEETSSVTVKHLSSRSVEDIPLPLPPLAEQRRIVAKIEELFSELDKGVESLKTAREQLKVYRLAILQHAFEGKLTARWREANPTPSNSEELFARLKQERERVYEARLKEWQRAVSIKTRSRNGKLVRKPKAPNPLDRLPAEVRESLPLLPDGWLWDKLGWMTCGVEYGTGAKSSKAGTHPVIRMGNIQNGRIDWNDLVYTSDAEEIAQYELKPGDVLFNRTNSPELVGKTAVYEGEQPALFAGYLIRVNHNPDVVDNRYLAFFLNSRTAIQYGNTVKTDGVNQSNINGEKLQGYPFPYCSLAEQREISRMLDDVFSELNRYEQLIEAELLRSDALRRSILQRAFSGQLVPQDANDEPAALLLERIRAEKTDPTHSRKGRKMKVAA